MDATMLRRARKLWTADFMPPEVNRANQRKWIRSIRMLGSKWLLAEYVQKLDTKGVKHG